MNVSFNSNFQDDGRIYPLYCLQTLFNFRTVDYLFDW